MIPLEPKVSLPSPSIQVTRDLITLLIPTISTQSIWFLPLAHEMDVYAFCSVTFLVFSYTYTLQWFKIILAYYFIFPTSVSNKISSLNPLLATWVSSQSRLSSIPSGSSTQLSARQGTNLRPGKTRLKSHMEREALTYSSLKVDYEESDQPCLFSRKDWLAMSASDPGRLQDTCLPPLV